MSRFHLLKAFMLISSNIVAMLMKLFYLQKLTVSLPLIADQCPSIMISKYGQIILSNTKFRRGSFLFADNGKIHFGKDCFVNNSCSFNSQLSITIGSRVLFGEGVKIYDHNHTIDRNITPMANSYTCNPISIGDDCWIGSNVIILSGVSICSNVVIGAGSVVTKSILEPGVYLSKDISSLTKIRTVQA